MENDNLSSSQEYKKKFFTNTESFFSKKTKYIYPEVKDATAILSSIASKPNFSQVRQRYKTKKFLGKFLLKSHMHWVLYSFTRKEILYIATQNHIGQSEINLQKLTILKYCNKSKDYNFVKKISIFRDKDFYEVIKEDKKKENATADIFKERSYGIFEENLKDKKQLQILKNIKRNIKRNI